MRKVLTLLLALFTLGVTSPALAADTNYTAPTVSAQNPTVAVRPVHIWHVSGRVIITPSPIASTAQIVSGVTHVVVKRLNGSVVGETTTGRDGRYFLYLPVGLYRISAYITEPTPCASQNMCSPRVHIYHSETEYGLVFPYNHNTFRDLHISLLPQP